MRITIVILVAFFALSGCGFQQGDALTFRTADPRLSFGVRLLPSPPGVIVPDVTPPCLVKGNIRNGERIYHQPWATNYSQVIIDPEHGEKYFCTADEAEAAGWRQALN